MPSQDFDRTWNEQTPRNTYEAMGVMMDWAQGRKSWTNLAHQLVGGNGPHGSFTNEDAALRARLIAELDAQEVVKWSAVVQAFAALERKDG